MLDIFFEVKVCGRHQVCMDRSTSPSNLSNVFSSPEGMIMYSAIFCIDYGRFATLIVNSPEVESKLILTKLAPVSRNSKFRCAESLRHTATLSGSNVVILKRATFPIFPIDPTDFAVHGFLLTPAWIVALCDPTLKGISACLSTHPFPSSYTDGYERHKIYASVK